MTKLKNTNGEMVKFFSRLGVSTGLPDRTRSNHLKKALGAVRYKKYLAIQDALAQGTAHGDDIYKLITTHEQAVALQNLHPELLLEGSTALYSQILPELKPGCRIADLGTLTGLFPAWIAHKHPDCSVVGIDRLPDSIHLSPEKIKQPNLSFVNWDYSKAGPTPSAPCDVLVCSFGIQFGRQTVGPCSSLQISDLRDCENYRVRLRELTPYFENWRKLATDNALLVTALRITDPDCHLALLDAAANAGWTWTREESSWFSFSEGFGPILTFRARPSSPVNQDEVLVFWDLVCPAPVVDCTYHDASAALLYQALGEKKIHTQKSTTLKTGVVVVCEFGTAGPLGYMFARSTGGATHFILVPTTNLPGLIQVFSDPSSDCVNW